MSNLKPDERPTAPQPAFISLPAACRAAIQHGNTIADIRIDRWATTYGDCGTERVKSEWEVALSELSREPCNSFECEGK